MHSRALNYPTVKVLEDGPWQGPWQESKRRLEWHGKSVERGKSGYTPRKYASKGRFGCSVGSLWCAEMKYFSWKFIEGHLRALFFNTDSSHPKVRISERTIEIPNQKLQGPQLVPKSADRERIGFFRWTSIRRKRSIEKRQREDSLKIYEPIRKKKRKRVRFQLDNLDEKDKSSPALTEESSISQSEEVVEEEVEEEVEEVEENLSDEEFDNNSDESVVEESPPQQSSNEAIDFLAKPIIQMVDYLDGIMGEPTVVEK